MPTKRKLALYLYQKQRYKDNLNLQMTNWTQNFCDTAMSMTSNSDLIPKSGFYTMLSLCSLISLKDFTYYIPIIQLALQKTYKIKMSKIGEEIYSAIQR